MKIILPDGSVEEAKDELRAIRHTASHVLAQAVKRLYPETKLAIGPAIDDGFYYDFDREGGFTPDDLETGERIRTPRGSFYVTAMSREQMEAAGYGVHHISDDGKYLIMGNGTRAFAVAVEQPEKDNPLRTAEMTLEDDYGMIDGVINNGRRGEELEKAQEYADRTTPEKPSIRERLEDAKRECAEHKPPEGKKPGRDVPEHDCL